MNNRSVNNLSAKMREEWNRRVSHDYRYWMSDGVESDEQMWGVGERDFEILTRQVPAFSQKDKIALEIGCGVGRLLRASAKRYQKVIGIDISDQALSEAQRLLNDLNNVDLVLGNGDDLHPVLDSSIDLVYAFASLSSMPVSVFAKYLSDASRVLRLGGYGALQVYLGKPQQTVEDDTIAIRSYEVASFEKVLGKLGFRLVNLEELILPFEISNHEEGLVASLVTLEKVAEPIITAEEVAQILLPHGEGKADQQWPGSETEYVMALARARQHMELGEAEQAREALEFATKYYAHADAEIRKMLSELQLAAATSAKQDLQKGHEVVDSQQLVSLTGFNSSLGGDFDPAIYEANMKVIKDRFPAVAERLLRVTAAADIEIVRSANNDPVVVYKKIPLDQRDKPCRAAETSVDRAINSFRAKSPDRIVVFGLGTGYQLEVLLQKVQSLVELIEPNIEVLKAALGVKDLRNVLARINSLSLEVKVLEGLKQKAASESIELLFHTQSKIISTEQASELSRLVYSSKAKAKLRPAIGVVGPLYGGSLPISHSVMRGVYQLQHRMRPFDLSVFHEPYKAMGSFVQNQKRIDAIENSYVEMVSSLVLESITERPVDILICLAQAPMSPKVLEEIRRRGIITVMWFVEDYKRFTTWANISKYYDYMFMIQRGDILKYVEQAGAGKAIYMPMACDPMVHRKLNLSANEVEKWGSDLSFVGAGYNNRQHVFASLANYNFKIWGTEWPTVVPFDKLVQDNARRLSVEEYVKIFNSSKINLNLHSSSERDGVEPDGDFVNPRTFELAASGAFQLVDNRVYLPELFDIKNELVTFADRQDLVAKIDHYLENPLERERYAAAAQKKVLSEHTYQQRIEQMLDHIYADHFDRLQSRLDSSPWKRTLESSQKYPELKNRFQRSFDRGDEPTLASLVSDIKQGSGNLSETERKILFFDNIIYQVKSAAKHGD